jgi:hypothetical protein
MYIYVHDSGTAIVPLFCLLPALNADFLPFGHTLDNFALFGIKYITFLNDQKKKETGMQSEVRLQSEKLRSIPPLTNVNTDRIMFIHIID